jgi:hypothetical protein
MNLAWRGGITRWAMAVALLLGPLALAARAADWTVLFRGSDSKLWNTAAGDPAAQDGYSTVVADAAPQTVRYLRLKRMDTGAMVIIAIDHHQILKKRVEVDDELIWCGGDRISGANNRLVGISRKSWTTATTQDSLIARAPKQTNAGFRGWGFGKPAGDDLKQTYSWDGATIGKTVFEIAVTPDDLNNDEKTHLLTFAPPDVTEEKIPPKPESGDSSPPTKPPSGPEAVDVGANGKGAATRISKLQTSIEALEIFEQPSGAMLGTATRFILTATPGESRKKGTVPVRFTSAVGREMVLVLGDVTRAINVHYGMAGVAKIELSFEDKYDAHDGGSIGAAIGTLMLSMIRGFDIDPNLAMTGDVSADAKVRKIGGVAAKLRGAAEAGCTIVALPTENLQQVQDAMVYEGTGIVTDVNVIGISDLDEAAAIARTDRDANVAKAIRLFAEIRESIKDSSDNLYSAETVKKLQQVLALEPNDFSAQMLILAADHKIPRLSARASEYYTIVATKELLDSINQQKAAGSVTPLNPSAVDAALTKLNKLRPIADLTIRPWIDSWIDYIHACDELRQGEVSRQYANEKYQAMMNEAVKLDANQELSEKMMHEGV